MIVRWLLLALVCVLSACSGDGNSPPSVITLHTAQAELQPDGQPARHKRVELRHRWDKEFPGLSGRATYRLDLPPSRAEDTRALWFPYVGNQAEVRINGVEVHRFGDLGDPRIDAGKAGQMVVVPSALFHQDRPDLLEIEVTMQPLRAGGLSAVHYGPATEIDLLHARQRLWEQSTSAAYTASFLLMGGLAAGLWWRQRDANERVYSSRGLQDPGWNPSRLRLQPPRLDDVQAVDRDSTPFLHALGHAQGNEPRDAL